jgi:transcriptional regulator with XRE-family HTH domain
MTNKRSSTIHDARYRRLIEILIESRVSAGISQLKIAVELGISQPDVSKVERFVRRIDALEFFDWVIALAALSNNDPKELLSDIYLCASRPHSGQKKN